MRRIRTAFGWKPASRLSFARLFLVLISGGGCGAGGIFQGLRRLSQSRGNFTKGQTPSLNSLQMGAKSLRPRCCPHSALSANSDPLSYLGGQAASLRTGAAKFEFTAVLQFSAVSPGILRFRYSAGGSIKACSPPRWARAAAGRRAKKNFTPDKKERHVTYKRLSGVGPFVVRASGEGDSAELTNCTREAPRGRLFVANGRSSRGFAAVGDSQRKNRVDAPDFPAFRASQRGSGGGRSWRTVSIDSTGAQEGKASNLKIPPECLLKDAADRTGSANTHQTPGGGSRRRGLRVRGRHSILTAYYSKANKSRTRGQDFCVGRAIK